MPKFIQPVSMIFDHTNFYKDNLEKQLIDLGYVFKDFSEKYRFDTLITNYGGKDGDDNIITNLDGSCKDDYNRYYIDNYNPELFLAIAAMTNDKTGIVGEWINIHNFGSQYPSHPAVMEYLNTEEYNESYIGLAKIIENELDSKDFGEEIIVVLGIDNNIYVLNESNINNKYYKKATLNELVGYFTMKKEDKEISTLPEYFAIFNDITNPLWSNYIVWLNDKYNKDYKGCTITCYYGYDGQVKRDSNISNFKNNPTIITLEQWNNIINGNQIKQTMKQKLTVSASDITKLYNVACVSWMKIIAGYLAEVNSNREITFTQADIDKMFKAATSEQLLVLESIFGKQVEPIDYSKLKTGSVVMLEFTGRIFGSKKDAEKVNFNEPFTIVFYNTPYYINSSNIYRDKSEYYDKIITFNQVNNGIGQFIAYNTSDMNYIVKVISY